MGETKGEGESETNSECFFFSLSFHFDPVLKCIPLDPANQRHLEIPSLSLTEREIDRDRERNRIGHRSFFQDPPILSVNPHLLILQISLSNLHPSILQPNIHLVMLNHPPITPIIYPGGAQRNALSYAQHTRAPRSLTCMRGVHVGLSVT